MFRTNVPITMIHITRIHLNIGIVCSEKVLSYALHTLHLLLKLCHRKLVNGRHVNSGLPHVDWENWINNVMKVILIHLLHTCSYQLFYGLNMQDISQQTNEYDGGAFVCQKKVLFSSFLLKYIDDITFTITVCSIPDTWGKN